MSNNLSLVTRIGAGVRLTASATESIVATLPEGFDYKARGAVADMVHAWACGDKERPAVKTGPAGNQKATDYGRGVDALVKSVKRALSSADESPKEPALRVTLSGDVSGSATVAADHPLYAALVALATGEDVDYAALAESLPAPTLAVVADAA